VLVSGSRTWTDTPAITRVLDQLRAWQAERLAVVHGACPNGVDAIADTWCRHNSVPAERHPADWSRHGRAAGPRRNTAMVATKPALCLAFIRAGSAGATGCANTAESAGITTIRYRPDPSTGDVFTDPRCTTCGAEYPRPMPAGQDPRCWTCWLADPGWWTA
jgi:hypothetical protein